jgi:CRP/FNR family transcriptional regulator, cyclic AMP receptor protein
VVFGLFRGKNSTPRTERLRALSLFVNLTPGELKIVEGLLHERQFLKDEIIFDKGDEGQAIYIIIDGSVLIWPQGKPVDGQTIELGPGTFFGDLALLDNSVRSAQARAATNTTLAVFFRADFMSLLETHGLIASKISLQLARHIGKRLREAHNTASGGQHL